MHVYMHIHVFLGVLLWEKAQWYSWSFCFCSGLFVCLRSFVLQNISYHYLNNGIRIFIGIALNLYIAMVKQPFHNTNFFFNLLAWKAFSSSGFFFLSFFCFKVSIREVFISFCYVIPKRILFVSLRLLGKLFPCPISFFLSLFPFIFNLR